VEETTEAKAAREAFEETIKPYQPSDAEKAALAQFAKDFPNEYAAVEARLKSVDRDINSRVHEAVKAIVGHMDPRLSSVEATTIHESAERHFAALHTAHPDYDTVIAAVPAWIKTQPAYLQPAMQQVYDQGTTADVSSLVADYKKSAGITVAAPAPAPVPAPKPAADAANLAPVTTRRSAAAPTKGTPDPNDFEGAWAELSSAQK
jgi:hypothetical protein